MYQIWKSTRAEMDREACVVMVTAIIVRTQDLKTLHDVDVQIREMIDCWTVWSLKTGLKLKEFYPQAEQVYSEVVLLP